MFKILTLKQLFVYLTSYGTYLTLGVKRSVGIIINLPTILSYKVYKLVELNNTIISDELEDYPDSPVNTSTLFREAASFLLDSEDMADAMDTGNFPSGATAQGELGNPSGSCSTQTIREAAVCCTRSTSTRHPSYRQSTTQWLKKS